MISVGGKKVVPKNTLFSKASNWYKKSRIQETLNISTCGKSSNGKTKFQKKCQVSRVRHPVTGGNSNLRCFK